MFTDEKNRDLEGAALGWLYYFLNNAQRLEMQKAKAIFTCLGFQT